MQPLVRRDKASREFSVHVDPADPDRIMLYEIWSSRGGLDQLLATQPVQEHFLRVRELLSGEPESSDWTLVESKVSALDNSGAQP